jgi:pectate lyase
VTLRGRGLEILGTNRAHDVIVKNLRFRVPAYDGITIAGGAYRILVDHVSVQGAGDGAIDITQYGTRDITIRWSIFGEPAGPQHTMLINYQASGISLHHNLFVNSLQRNPSVAYQAGTYDPSTTADIRNNLIWNWYGGMGTLIRYGARANVVNNYYGGATDRDDALWVCKGQINFTDCGGSLSVNNRSLAYVSGNFIKEGLPSGSIPLNSRGTSSTPYEAPTGLLTSTATRAALGVRNEAGAQPRDATDQRLVGYVRL